MSPTTCRGLDRGRIAAVEPDGSPDDDALDRVRDDELPVVARMVVEIRSDGRRTIARGAMEDPEGHRVTVEARGTTPWMLAKELASALWSMPKLPRPSLRALLPGRRRRRGE